MLICIGIRPLIERRASSIDVYVEVDVLVLVAVDVDGFYRSKKSVHPPVTNGVPSWWGLD
jgi:hypothetical protein